MKIEFDCIPCIYRQLLEASRMVTKDERVIEKVMLEFARMIPEIKPEETALEVTAGIQNYLKKLTGKADPYQDFKEANIKLALEHYPFVEKIIRESEDPLLGALVMAAMGNSIDAAVGLDVDIAANVEKAIQQGFKHSDYRYFRERLSGAKRVLVIADNTGEAVFDRLLLQELRKLGLELIYAVRNQPVLNDITLKEARKIGIDQYCRVISSGCDFPGTLLDKASDEFKKIFSEAEIIISKGQGNLEGLMEEERKIYYLLKVKCQLIARKLGSGINTGDFVFLYR